MRAASAAEFALISDLVRRTARAAPERVALIDGERRLSYREFDALIDRVAAALQRDGVAPRETIAICAASSIAAKRLPGSALPLPARSSAVP